MSETPVDKKPDLSNFPRGAIGMKGWPVDRNARLPSIRSPRDLTLGAPPKRVFMPNIPVRREKRLSEPIKEVIPPAPVASTSKLESRNSNPKAGRGRGKEKAQIIQTEGAVFGEGIAASPSKGRKPESMYPKSIVRKTAVKTEKLDDSIRRCIDEDQELADQFSKVSNFIDDGGSEDSDDDAMNPVMFPIQNVETKTEEKEDNIDFATKAKECNFDIAEVAKHIKKEKSDFGAKIPPDLPKNDITNLLTSGKDSMFLMKLPAGFPAMSPDEQSKTQNSGAGGSTKNENATNLSTLPEGTLGKIQVMKSGAVRLLVGGRTYNIGNVRELKTKKQAVAIKTQDQTGDLVILGNVTHQLSVIPDV